MRQVLLAMLTTVLISDAAGKEMSPVLPMSAENRRLYEEDAAERVRLARAKRLPLPKRGQDIVASEDVAVQIHLVIASSIFGKEHVDKQRPFFALRQGEFWVVYGSLPINHLGGTAVTVIRASNGEIVGAVHQQ
jgi:hypothetical protein